MDNEIIYEHPMNERIRGLLRLEHLYAIIRYHLKNNADSDYITVLATLLEISELLLRSDIKNEIIKELKRQSDVLNTLKNSEEIDEDRLSMAKNLINEHHSAGTHNFTFDGSQLASGVYFYSMTKNGVTKTRKLVLMK